MRNVRTSALPDAGGWLRITVQDDVRDAILSEAGAAWKLHDRNAHVFDRDWRKGYSCVIGTRASANGRDRLFDDIAVIMDSLHDNG